MEKIAAGQNICPFCGHNNAEPINDETVLREGTILNGKYLVGRVLGRGGFGITYLGIDIDLEIKVAIKEYFPNGITTRQINSRQVKITNGSVNSEGFNKGKEAFQQEARTLAMFNSPNIAHVREYFLENNTAYIVMDFVDGVTFSSEIRHCGGQITWKRVLSLFMPLIPELDCLHKKNMIHRDIKPENLKVVTDKNTGKERLVLLDFGAARSYISSNLTKTYTQILTPGFAPFEQYQARTHLGPFTDIYALCATMYTAISGQRPPAAPDRIMGDEELKPFSSFGIDVPANVESAIFHGMALNYKDRPQTLLEIYREFQGAAMETAPSSALVPDIVPLPKNYDDNDHNVNSGMPSRTDLPKEPDTFVSKETAISGSDPKSEIENNRRNGKSGRSLIFVLFSVLLLAGLSAGYFTIIKPKNDQKDAEKTQSVINAEQTENALKITGTAEVLPGVYSEETAAEEAVLLELLQITGTQEILQITRSEAVVPTNTLMPAAAKEFGETPVPVDPAKTREAQMMAESTKFMLQTESAESTAAAQLLAIQLTQSAEELLSIYATQTEIARPTEMPVNTPESLMTYTDTPYPTEMTAPEETAERDQAYTSEEFHLTATPVPTLELEETPTNEPAAASTLSISNTPTENFILTPLSIVAAKGVVNQPGDIGVLMYDVPSKTGNIMRSLMNGSAVFLTGERRPRDGGIWWTKIKTESGLSGWIQESSIAISPEIVAGDTFTFGKYEQDNVPYNGSEAIEWQVLDIQNNRMLVISKYGLDVKPYNEAGTGTDWLTSGLRRWMNEDFFNAAFNNVEQARILSVPVSNGSKEVDRLYQMSITDVNKYFPEKNLPSCLLTDYAAQNGDNGSDLIFWGPEYIAEGKTEKVIARPAFWMDISDLVNSESLIIITPTADPVLTLTPIRIPEKIDNGSGNQSVEEEEEEEEEYYSGGDSGESYEEDCWWVCGPPDWDCHVECY